MTRYGEVYAITSRAGVYVGSTLGYATRRWAEHLRLLRSHHHHCARLQVLFDEVGPLGLSFRVVAAQVSETTLRAEEYAWTKALFGINAPPASEVQREMQQAICADIAAGLTYRTIAYKHGVSLGTVAAVKAKYRIVAPVRNRRVELTP